jgi:tRNA(Arg) A34 adenosine deaminase TadA
MSGMHPPSPEGRLKDFWNLPVRDLASLPNPVFTEPVRERHTIFSLLVLALTYGYWNGNKRGPIGEYPWRPSQRDPLTKRYAGGDYLGHNIACIAVDDRGAILDFDFNHNDALNSSVEHAESRLIRRLFSMTQLYDFWEGATNTKAIPYSTVLSNVTIYTSLESCSQCSGIMALGSVKDVVFLQRIRGRPVSEISSVN